LVATSSEGVKEEDLKQDLAHYIEGLRDKMLTNKVCYEDGCGLMEISG
jgi:hypothetical protein